MDSKIAAEERINFGDRLCAALRDAGQPSAPTAFVRAYNLRADGAAVTSHAARKWLRGEALPTQEKILIIARWLNVHAAWLRFGDADNSSYNGEQVELPFTNQDLILINDIRDLHPQAQVIVRDLVDSLMRIAAGVEPKDMDQVFRGHTNKRAISR